MPPMAEAYTDMDVELVAAAVHEHDRLSIDLEPTWEELGEVDQDSYRALARVVLDALAAAGRLMPLDDEPHMIEFREDGWTISHPLACRPRLFECEINRAAEQQVSGPPAVGLGRYECDVINGDFVLTHEVTELTKQEDREGA
jgi:hypothetical protein